MTTAVLDVRVDCDLGVLASLYSDVSVSIMRITPDIAAQMLERNVRNRPLIKRHYASIGDIILQGDYLLNGETIVLDRDGNLLDGQHRLHGCILSGMWFDTIVVRGIDPDAFDTIDGGRARTTGEVLAIDGEANANAVSSAVAQFVQFVDCGGRMFAGTAGHIRKATPRVASRVLSVHPGLRDSVAAMRRCPIYRNQQAYVLHYLFSLVSETLAEDFSAVLTDGATDVGRPFNVLRESMIRSPVNTATRRQFAAKCIKAFNAEKSGDRPKMFRFNDSEGFPTIDGLDYEKLAYSIGR